MFIKGPVVWAFVLPPLVLYQFCAGDGVPIFRMHGAGGFRGLLPSPCSVYGLSPGIRFIDGFYEDVVLIEFAGRFHEGIHRSQPLLFYIPHLLQKFAPWSLLIIGLLVVALRKTKATTGKWLAGLSPEMFFLVAWVVGGIAGDVVDSIETGGSNLSGRSSPLSSPGCATTNAINVACVFADWRRSPSFSLRFLPVPIRACE